MTKLVFHLGDMKTGSTAIQAALSSKAWVCSSVSLIYPAGNRISHMALAQSLQGQIEPGHVERLVLEILAHIEATPADIAVISAEHFENVDPAVLKSVLQQYMPEHLKEARFLAYVRPHAERLPSSYAEKIKTGQFSGTMTELHAQMFKRQSLHYLPRFQSWLDTFGPAFTLRPMIRDLLYRNDVVADFFEFALQTRDFTLSPTPDSNESVSLENLAILAQIHLKLGSGRQKGASYQSTIARALSRRMNDSAFRTGTKIRLHKALAETMQADYAEDAAALDAAFFSGTPMSDALATATAKATDTEQSVRLEDHYTPREQYLIHLLLDQTCVLIRSDPDFLADVLRNEYRGNVVAEGEAPAVRRGAGRKAGLRKGAGRMGQRRMAGKRNPEA